MSEKHFISCTLCEAMCGLEVEVSGRRVLSIRGDLDDPFSRGHICPKANALKDLHEDPDRLKTPMRRVGSSWQKVGWDEALDFAAERIHEVQQRRGDSAIAAYLGNPNIHNLGSMLFAPPFVRALHTKNRFSATSVDQLPHMLAAYRVFGHQLLMPVPDIDHSRFMLILGANPLASNGSIMSAPGVKKRLEAIQERGGRVVVVDPRRTETAKMADQHVAIRPGTDALLLLAMVHTVFGEGLVELGHLNGHVRGLQTLERLAARFTPERVAVPTGVDAETIRGLSRELAGARHGVCYGRLGTCVQEFGGISAWLLLALNTISGNLDRVGGMMFTSPVLDSIDAPKGFGVGRGSYGRWRSRVRELPEFGGELPVATLAEEILEPGDGQIRALVTVAGNPVLSTPNGRRLDEALESLDLMVAIDPYLNETTRHADVILPPVSPLERDHYDLALHVLAVRNTARFSPAVFPRSKDTRHDWEILLGLQLRLERLRHGALHPIPLKTAALLAVGPRPLVDAGLRLGPHGPRPYPLRSGISLKKLMAHPHGMDFGPLEPCLPGRLPKERRAIELCPSEFAEDVERLDARFPEDWSGDGGLLLIGRRQLRGNNSWLHNASSLMRGRDRCTLKIHPDDAKRVGVVDRASAVVRSRVGEVVVPVEVSDEMMPGVVSIPHGFGHARGGTDLHVADQNPGVSINDLVDDQVVDSLSGSGVLNGVEVEVMAVADAAE